MGNKSQRKIKQIGVPTRKHWFCFYGLYGWFYVGKLFVLDVRDKRI